jgi:hypothetical protein
VLNQYLWTLCVKKCQEAIRQVIERIDQPGIQEEDFLYEDFRLGLGIREYSEQNLGISSSSAGILDLQSVENADAQKALRNFFEFLSKVRWAKVILATEPSMLQP